MASFIFLMITLHALILSVHTYAHTNNTCRSFCGNLTVDYPFALQPGCGHGGFRDLLYCINDVLMLHIPSGSYRVLDIDYPYTSLVLHDPHMSTCQSLFLGARGNGFALEPWRAPFLTPAPDNAFMLLGCSARSPLFQRGEKHPPCRNVSGLGCEEYYGCPAWDFIGPRAGSGRAYGSGPPDCCAVSYESVKSVNLSRLDCQGYSSVYSSAPLRVSGPSEWAYGIQVTYSDGGSGSFCMACEASGGSCGYDVRGNTNLCLCGSWNSTSNCDSVLSNAFNTRRWPKEMAITGLLITAVTWRTLTIFG
ncbi:hypothetical protein ACP275_04G176100 [Erythranthe tilingii]